MITSLVDVRIAVIGLGYVGLPLAVHMARYFPVVGFDIDVEATVIAHQTAAEQRPSLPVSLFAGSVEALRLRPAFDLVLANLIPAEAQPLLPGLRALLAAEGLLVLAGLMEDQRAGSEAELAANGFVVERLMEREEWVGLVCVAAAIRPRTAGPEPPPGLVRN